MRVDEAIFHKSVYNIKDQ